MEQDKTATLVKDNLPEFHGHAALYRMVPPLEDHAWDERPVEKHEYVIASAASVLYSGPETYLFPATADGEVKDWGELPGSMKRTLSHAVAMANAGYRIVADQTAVAGEK